MSLEKEPIYSQLNEDDELSDSGLQNAAATTEAMRMWRRRFFVLLGFCIAGFSLLVMLLNRSAVSRSYPAPMGGIDIPYTPVDADHLKYVNKHLDKHSDGKEFRGEPRPELDQAWHELLAGTLLHVTDEELRLSGNASSIPHKKGGYVAGLGVSHNLHCIKRIKQYFHKDYYYPGDQDWDELAEHADHCLDSLRKFVLCKVDTSIYTLKWTPHNRKKPSTSVPQAHACVNWDSVHEWMIDHAALLEDMSGPPDDMFKDGEGGGEWQG